MTTSRGPIGNETHASRRRAGVWTGAAAILVLSYFVARLLWPPVRPPWTGLEGTILEWLWWIGIGVAVGFLARAGSPAQGASRGPAGRPSPVALLLVAWLLLSLRWPVLVWDRAAVVVLDLTGPSRAIAIPCAFVLGFYHRLAAAYLAGCVQASLAAARSAAGGLARAWASGRAWLRARRA